MRIKFHNFFKIYNGFFLSNFDLWNLSRAYLHKKQLEKTGFFIYNFQRIYLNQIFNSKCCTFFLFSKFYPGSTFYIVIFIKKTLNKFYKTQSRCLASASFQIVSIFSNVTCWISTLFKIYLRRKQQHLNNVQGS